MKVVISLALVGATGATACGGGDDGATASGFAVVAAPGDTLIATAGDAIQLEVVQQLSDDSQSDLPMGATAVFTAPVTVAALDADSTAESPFPAFGAAPTGVFITNALRTDRADDLAGVLFVLDPGTAGSGEVDVTATISGSASGSAAVGVPVSALAAGNAAQGATTYAAACARCHGGSGEGTAVGSDGMYEIDGTEYPYPAPGLNTADGNLASDPAWSAALLAVAARSDVDNSGLVLRRPMPDWLTEQVNGAPLSTQDFADLYAFLKTK